MLISFRVPTSGGKTMMRLSGFFSSLPSSVEIPGNGQFLEVLKNFVSVDALMNIITFDMLHFMQG